MKGQIDREEKSRRLHALEAIAKASQSDILNNEISSSPIKKVLFETYANGFAYGHTDNFLEVAVPCKKDLRSELLTVRLTKAENGICFGEIIENDI